MATNDSVHREILPIPDLKPICLATYDAKDLETKFPPIKVKRSSKFSFGNHQEFRSE
jgi:hypothetical protein